MVGGLLDLVAKGGQDIYFICNPEISFFKKVYKKHTNFSTENIKFPLNDISFGKIDTAIIPRVADLLTNIFLEIELPLLDEGQSYINYIGYGIIDYIELCIGETVIQRLTGETLYILNEYKLNHNKKKIYNKIVGGKYFMNYNTFVGNKGGKYTVPLNFWFTEDISQSIPLVALQHHDIQIKLKYKKFDELYITKNNTQITDSNNKIKTNFILEMVFLDVEERSNFAKSDHEYLITQIQYNLNNNILKNQLVGRYSLNFFNPIRELFFVIQNKKIISNKKDLFNFSKDLDLPLEPLKNAQILFNNSERFEKMESNFFRFINNINKHTNLSNNFIYNYTFSLDNDEYLLNLIRPVYTMQPTVSTKKKWSVAPRLPSKSSKRCTKMSPTSLNAS